MVERNQLGRNQPTLPGKQEVIVVKMWGGHSCPPHSTEIILQRSRDFLCDLRAHLSDLCGKNVAVVLHLCNLTSNFCNSINSQVFSRNKPPRIVFPHLLHQIVFRSLPHHLVIQHQQLRTSPRSKFP